MALKHSDGYQSSSYVVVCRQVIEMEESKCATQQR